MLLEYLLRELRIFCTNEVGMMKVPVWSVSRLLTLDIKRTRVIISRDNLTLFKADQASFIERFLTKDD